MWATGPTSSEVVWCGSFGFGQKWREGVIPTGHDPEWTTASQGQAVGRGSREHQRVCLEPFAMDEAPEQPCPAPGLGAMGSESELSRRGLLGGSVGTGLPLSHLCLAPLCDGGCGPSYLDILQCPELLCVLTPALLYSVEGSIPS